MPAELSERQRRLLDTVLVFGVIALGFVVVADVAGVLAYFADILLLFFLALADRVRHPAADQLRHPLR